MADLKNTVPGVHMRRKRRFHVHPYSLGSGFQNFDIPNFRISRPQKQNSRETRSNFDLSVPLVSHPNPVACPLPLHGHVRTTADSQVSRFNTITHLGFQPEPTHYLADWFNCISWPILAFIIALNLDLQFESLALLFGLVFGLALLIARCFE